MGKRRRTVPWYKRGKLWVVHPGWNKRVELTFTEQAMMIDWAHGARVVLKEVNRPNGGVAHGEA